MNISHFTPGTGHFVCGSCLRDNTLVAALRQRDHAVSMVPLYLPFALEDGQSAADRRVFLGGLNMYLLQKLPILRWVPRGVLRGLDRPQLLRWLSTKAGMTEASGLGAMVVSALRGESGRQAVEVDQLVDWMTHEPRPDVLCLSNIMLIGLARRLRERLKAPVICSLQGEAPFLDALPEPYRSEAWRIIAERAQDVAAFVPVSRHYGEVVRERAKLPAEKIHPVHNGIDVATFPEPADPPPAPAVIGYLARMCPDKGLHTLVDAFCLLKKSGAADGVRLEVAGVMLDEDRPYVEELRARLERVGAAGDAAFHPNVDRATKMAFLRSLSVLSVPATYGESFGLFVIEALACGVPVVEPRHGAFPELLEATGGGRLCEPDDPVSLADELRHLLEHEDERRALGDAGRRAVRAGFSADHMAAGFEDVCKMVAGCPTSSP